MKKYIALPNEILHILDELNKHGFEAYVVGGAVRNFLMQKDAYDFDITTNAKPEEIKSIFKKTIDTGIKHGTVTVKVNDVLAEVTTYRIDKDYKDHRRPDTVEFSSSLFDDLKRRDFTINALCYNPKVGIIDKFGGIDDIKNGVIKSIGDADERFCEDALRMLRAARFSCQLGFKIDNDTLVSISKNRHLIDYISGERIKAEFDRILMSDNIENIIPVVKTGLIDKIIPEFSSLFMCAQNSKHHIYDVGNHTIQSVKNSKKDICIRWTMLLHDIGKPYKKTTDKYSDHFKGHPDISFKLSRDILNRLKFSNSQKRIVLTLIKYHDCRIKNDEIIIKKLLNYLGEDIFELLLEVQRADSIAQSPKFINEKLENLNAIYHTYRDILSSDKPYKIKHLAVSGSDIINFGKNAREVGKILNKILDYVIYNPSKNNKYDILKLLEKGDI